ncbi:MAG: hypothetical protein M0Z79_12385 [Nitrospiraceae bacterium]|nr:hypothetical protein [Nitrospiraceae bacterium]
MKARRMQRAAAGNSALSLRQRFSLVLCVLFVSLAGSAVDLHALPETVSVRVTDVTPVSFSVIWMTDVAADPEVEVYRDSAMQSRITDQLAITAMPSASPEVAQAAKSRGIMKVRVAGLEPSTVYFVKTVTKDPAVPSNVACSTVQTVTTAAGIMTYSGAGGTARPIANDLLSFRTYLMPASAGDAKPNLGQLVVLEEEGAAYPVSAFAGDRINTPEGLIDLNNLFGPGYRSLPVAGGEKVVLRIYRGGTLSTLAHYRRLATSTGMTYVAEPAKGFFADINLDGRVDDQDFVEFRKQYRTSPDSLSYNPDFNFVEDPEGKVDAREFSRFVKEYGRTDVK